MSDPFLGEIRMFACNFPPRNFQFCNGQVMAITQNTALFALLGTLYGGNGTTTFALPNLQGRVPMGAGPGPGLARTPGETGGSASVTLTANQVADHVHTIGARSTRADRANASAGASLARTADPFYSTAPSVAMSADAISTVGGGQAHNNMQPYTAISFCIAVAGLFPSRN